MVCSRKSREKKCERGREVTPQMKQERKKKSDRIRGEDREMERRKRNLQKERKIIKEKYNKEVTIK